MNPNPWLCGAAPLALGVSLLPGTMPYLSTPILTHSCGILWRVLEWKTGPEMGSGFTWRHAITLLTQSIPPTPCHMDMAPGAQAHGHSLGGAYTLFPPPADSCSMAKTTQL